MKTIVSFEDASCGLEIAVVLETVSTSTMPVSFYQTTKGNIPDGIHLYLLVYFASRQPCRPGFCKLWIPKFN
jgi:hypothetical protein